MIAALYFDGKTALAHPVTLVAAHGHLSMSGDFLLRQDALHTLRVSETFAYAPTILQYADGAHCEIRASQDKAALLAMLSYRPSLVQKAQQYWQSALFAVLAILFFLLSFRYWGLPWISAQVTDSLPIEVEQRLGKSILQEMEKGWIKPTAATPEQVQRIEQAFAVVAPSGGTTRVLLRNVPAQGANAFAVPGGTILITDDMVKLICAGSFHCSDAQLQQLSAIFAHELGHIAHRHSLKSMVSDSVNGMVSLGLFGDFSALAAGAPMLLVKMSFSREIETQADDYGWELLAKKGIDQENMLLAYEKMLTQSKAKNLPAWLRSSSNYLSTHPSDEERIAHFKERLNEIGKK